MRSVLPARPWHRLLWLALLLALSLCLPAPVASAEDPDPNTPAVGEIVNRGLPSWLKIGGDLRFRTERRNDEGLALTRFRLGVEIRPSSWFNAYVEGQDSRAFGIDPSRNSPALKDAADLRQAWVKFSSEKETIALKAGRQELSFGEERLVGASGWGNTSRVFDAVRLTVKSTAARVDIFSASPVVNRLTRFDNHVAGDNLHGVYGSLPRLLPQATVEPFVFWKTAHGASSETGRFGKASVFTAGARVNGRIGRKIDYTTEMARQGGQFAGDQIGAWAGMWRAGYTPAAFHFNTHFYAEYNYATGDSAKGDGRSGTFDQLYPTNHAYYGTADAVGWRNVRDLRVGGDVRLHSKIRLNVEHHFFNLASAADGLYSDSGLLTVAAPAGGALHSDIGREVDVVLTYRMNQQLSIGAGWGHLFPGRFLKENAPNAPTSYPYFQLNYIF